ncbi:MAG TPA: hypothetical protein VM344_01240 [Vitreimonas sp.]|nr:hypothetical protein [Vitreimonas sp.]
MNIGEALEGFWNSLLELTSQFVLPDWEALIGLLPVFLLIGVLGPILSLLLLVHFIYFLRKPRAPLGEPPEPVPARIGDDGKPVVPRGEPFCYRDGLIYPANATRCDTCGDDLTVRCPKCEVARSASVDTCGNCGLVLKVRPQNQVVRATQPPPGGRAAA